LQSTQKTLLKGPNGRIIPNRWSAKKGWRRKGIKMISGKKTNICVGVWLSDESKRKEVLDFTKGLRFKPGNCYNNAFKCVMADASGSVEYLEGYMLEEGLGSFIHAWCKFKDTDIYFDPTPNYVPFRADSKCKFIVVKVYDLGEFHRISSEKRNSKKIFQEYWPFPLTKGLDLYCLNTLFNKNAEEPFNPADYTKEAIAKMVG
jgi:hypothetical protein